MLRFSLSSLSRHLNTCCLWFFIPLPVTIIMSSRKLYVFLRPLNVVSNALRLPRRVVIDCMRNVGRWWRKVLRFRATIPRLIVRCYPSGNLYFASDMNRYFAFVFMNRFVYDFGVHGKFYCFVSFDCYHYG